MALACKLPMKKMSLNIFGQLDESILSIILAIGAQSTRIDIILDVYQESSIKQMECEHRSCLKQITITISSENQKIPVDLDMFWSSMLNKVRLQEYVFKWMLQMLSEKEIFLGGVYRGECRKLLTGNETEIVELSSNQEEAYDRIMFHINNGIVIH